MHLIFDFDGTLVDSFEQVINAILALSDKFQYKKLTKGDIEKLRNLPSVEMIQYLDIPLHKVPILLDKIKNNLHDIIVTLPPITHIKETIHTLAINNHHLGIVTSNSEKNVALWLKHQKLEQYFNFVHSEDFLSKGALLEKILQENMINKNETYYIGDETRDIDAANDSQIKSIAVTWGYHSEKLLRSHHPTHLISSPDEIIKICS